MLTRQNVSFSKNNISENDGIQSVLEEFKRNLLNNTFTF